MYVVKYTFLILVKASTRYYLQLFKNRTENWDASILALFWNSFIMITLLILITILHKLPL